MNTIHDDHGILLQLITVFPLELDDNDDVQVVVLMLIILSACVLGRCVWLLMGMTMNNVHLALHLQTHVWLSSGRSLPSRVTRSRQWHLLLGGESLQLLSSF